MFYKKRGSIGASFLFFRNKLTPGKSDEVLHVKYFSIVALLLEIIPERLKSITHERCLLIFYPRPLGLTDKTGTGE
jgi:hypothetical protein